MRGVRCHQRVRQLRGRLHRGHAEAGADPDRGDRQQRHGAFERDHALEPAERSVGEAHHAEGPLTGLTESLPAYIGHPAYGPDALRADLDRFTFLLGGSDGEDLESVRDFVRGVIGIRPGTAGGHASSLFSLDP